VLGLAKGSIFGTGRRHIAKYFSDPLSIDVAYNNGSVASLLAA
jgi:hypothetical protein